MLNRLTVSALLKTVILVTSFCVVVGFSLNAWDAWGRLQAASRIAVDRRCLGEHVQGDAQSAHRPLHDQPAAEFRRSRWTPTSRNICATSATPKCRRWATRSACSAASNSRSNRRWCRSSTALFKTMTALQKEFWEAMAKPKASRRPDAGQGVHGYDQRDAGDARQAVGRAGRRRQPPGRRPSTSCWRSSRSPGCCATPPAKPR